MKITDGADTARPAWTPYIPKLFYRDVVPVDPDHIDPLRARDLELFIAHGRFARHVVPREFGPDVMARLGADSYVVVSFTGDKWHRQLARQRVTVPRSRKRVK